MIFGSAGFGSAGFEYKKLIKSKEGEVKISKFHSNKLLNSFKIKKKPIPKWRYIFFLQPRNFGGLHSFFLFTIIFFVLCIAKYYCDNFKNLRSWIFTVNTRF